MVTFDIGHKDMLVFVAGLRKKEIILRRTLGVVLKKQSYKTKIFNHSVASF